MGTNTNVKFFEKTRYQWDIQKETDNARLKSMKRQTSSQNLSRKEHYMTIKES